MRRADSHIKQSRRACPAEPLVSGTFAKPARLAIVVQAAGACHGVDPVHKRVIALDVHQAKITACAVVRNMTTVAWKVTKARLWRLQA